MKKLISILSLAVVTLAFVGCATTHTITTLPDGTTTTNTVTKLDPTRTANAIKAIIPPAVTFAVAQEPSAKDYIQKAQVAICAAASAGKFSPDELKAAVDATGIKEIQTPEVESALQAVYGVYSSYYGDVVAQKLNQNEWLIPVLSAICDGLKDGLAAIPTPPNTAAPFPTVPAL